MKSVYLVIAAVASALAVPAPQAPPKLYSLQTKSQVAALNNQFLSSKGGKVGLFPGAKESANSAAKVLATPYEPAQTLALSIGDPSKQIALAGSNGLLELVEVTNPTGNSIPKGQSMEWSTFTIDSRGNLNVKDGADIPTRKWVAYQNGDGSTGIGLYDGVTEPQTKKFQDVTIVAVAARQ
ncbi:hypothetical protein EJ08DRAFT_456517 [Tothia fuscella]|uniref:Uncharacterized protein n=1 Tax=Tothia fuscella TaxID=1048955 RepID=A0A9P4TUB3_9PEZI|nr:hypothetical protein EJ08DRAFT_456517 [Tothia fuscella]